MHRLFVQGYLKRQRNLRLPAAVLAARSDPSLGIICCSTGAAILLQEIGKWKVLLHHISENIIYFNYLDG
jgi:hypothetical protein